MELAKSLERHGNHEEAIISIDKAIEVCPSLDDRIEPLNMKGN